VSGQGRWLAAAALALLLGGAGCKDNMLVGGIKPVPAVHRIPPDLEGRVVLIAEDAIIESKDPVHIARARDRLIPQGFRASMTAAFGLAGFKVVNSPSERHDLVAKLALAVREEDGHIRQTYRCGLRGADGTEVVQIDWAWPEGTYVDTDDVFDYATHNVATEIAMSRNVLTYLRTGRGRTEAGAGVGSADAGAPSP
jgi:hypothetical protein